MFMNYKWKLTSLKDILWHHEIFTALIPNNQLKDGEKILTRSVFSNFTIIMVQQFVIEFLFLLICEYSITDILFVIRLCFFASTWNANSIFVRCPKAPCERKSWNVLNHLQEFENIHCTSGRLNLSSLWNIAEWRVETWKRSKAFYFFWRFQCFCMMCINER